MAMGESSESVIPADEPDAPDTEPAPDTTEEPPDDTPKKKKKKKKDRVKEEEREVEIAPSGQEDGNTTLELHEAMDEANGNEASEKKKKKKKKDKRLKEEEEEVELLPMEVHGSDSSGYVSDKPSKKRKHQTGSDVTSGFSEDPEPPKSKKKRKSDAEKSVWKIDRILCGNQVNC